MTSSNKLVVHIGLGKTATTTLQKHIFPTIAEMKGYAYNSNRLHELLYRQHLTTELTEERAVLDVNGGVKAYHWGVAKVGQLVSRLGA